MMKPIFVYLFLSTTIIISSCEHSIETPFADQRMDMEDFGKAPDKIYSVSNDEEWKNARFDIRSNGDGKNYVINVVESFVATPLERLSSFSEYASNISVSIRGKEIFTTNSKQGYVLWIEGDQRVILRSHLIGSRDNSYFPVVHVTSGAQFIMEEGSKISENSSGAVLVHVGSFVMNGGDISNNNQTSRKSQDEGAVVIKNHESGLSHFTMNNGTIKNNKWNGVVIGVIYYGDGDTEFIMNSGEITENGATGVSVGRGSFTMNDGQIRGNNGRGVEIDRETSSFTMHSGAINENKSGGVGVSDGIFTMNGGEINHNKGDIYSGETISKGGGVSIYYGVFSMTGGTIFGNVAWQGGGIYVGLGKEITISGGEISGNRSDVGGGVYLGDDNTSSGVDFKMTGGIINGNSALYGGGGIGSSSGGLKILISGGEISGNKALYGGGICVPFGIFRKEGNSIIYGENEGEKSNIAKSATYASKSNIYGHAVCLTSSQSPLYSYDHEYLFDVPYRNTTAGHGEDIIIIPYSDGFWTPPADLTIEGMDHLPESGIY